MSASEGKYFAHETFGLAKDVLESLTAAGHLSPSFQRKNSKGETVDITMTINDPERNVKEAKVAFETITVNTLEGAYALVGGDEKDEKGNVTRTAIQKVCDFVAAFADLKARAKARIDYIETFGTVDQTAQIEKQIKGIMKLLKCDENTARSHVATLLASVEKK